jgi:hypothetical protein
MTREERERFAEFLAAAGGIEPAELTAAGREVLAVLASAGRFMVAGVCDLVATAYRAGYAEAEETADRYEDGVPFFRHDAAVTVTVSAAELAGRGMPDDAVIGVCWVETGGDECIAHALAGAAKRAAGRPDDRGLVLYRGWWLDCAVCQAKAQR